MLWLRLRNSRRVGGDATLGRCQAGLDSPRGQPETMEVRGMGFRLALGDECGSGLHCRRMDPRAPAPGLVWYLTTRGANPAIRLFSEDCVQTRRGSGGLRGYLRVVARVQQAQRCSAILECDGCCRRTTPGVTNAPILAPSPPVLTESRSQHLQGLSQHHSLAPTPAKNRSPPQWGSPASSSGRS